MTAPGRNILALAAPVLASAASLWAQTLVLDEPLFNSTTGTRSGGVFLGDGWKVTGHTDSIYWHIPTLSNGAVEWEMRGLYPDENRAGMQDKAEIFHMYDYTIGDADVNYNGGYRDDPYKHFVRKIGAQGGTSNAMEIVWQILPNFEEPDTAALAWNANTTYRFREEWGPDGAGNSVLRTYRDGGLLRTTTVAGSWNPGGHSVRIAASPRAFVAADAGAPVDAVYRNLKVWDLTIITQPPPPLPPPRTGNVSLNGHALHDDQGDFLGLGASYFQALRRTKYDRARYRSDLDFLARRGVNYIRTLSMVGGNSAWAGKEIAPITFQNDQGQTIQAWPDYWQQFRDMIDIAYDEYGIRTEVTIFADAQNGMPNEADRVAHMNGLLNAIQGREQKVMMIEVANESWQNGFPEPGGTAKVREFGQYLADRTNRLVALSSPADTSNNGIAGMYQNSAADIATVHFSRDHSEDGWLPVRDTYRVNSINNIPPASSNEPIGPGSSVSSENSPIRLVSAAAYAWMSGLPAYVFHSSAGVFGNTRFEDMAAIKDNALRPIKDLLPGNIPNWPQRTEGKDAFAPFITYANGQANKWWTEVSGPTSGVVRHLSNVNGNQFYTLPIGILSGGVQLQARQNMTFQAFDPLTGDVAYEMTPSANQNFMLAQGPQAYLIRGHYATPGQNAVSINLDRVNDPDGMTHPRTGDGDTIPFTIGARNARRNDNTAEDFYMYFAAADWFTYRGQNANLFVTIEYFDDGTGPLTLQYDSNTGNTLPAFYKAGGSVQRGNTDTWKKHVFQVTDAYFGNRQNYGSDFRISGGVGSAFYLDSVMVSTARPAARWNVDGGGTWSTARNWLDGPPDSVNMGATFGSVISNPATVTVDAPHTVGAITFDNTNSYQIAGNSTLTLGVTTGSAAVSVVRGNHTISAPLALVSNVGFDIASGSTLTVSSLLDNSMQVTKSGSGTLVVNRVRAAGLSVFAGKVKVLPGGGTGGVSRLATLSVSPGAALDLSDNRLILQNSTAGTWNGTTYTGAQGLIASGRNGGGWGGSGIVTSQSSATSGNFTSIGVATAQQVKGLANPGDTAVWGGQTVTGSDTLVMYTYGGDANLDGKINVDDYGRIDFNAPLSTSGWYNGDFNYDGKINVDDYGILDFNIGTQGPPFSTAGGLALGQPLTVVPEPASLSLASIAAGWLELAARRRRSVIPATPE